MSRQLLAMSNMVTFDISKYMFCEPQEDMDAQFPFFDNLEYLGGQNLCQRNLHMPEKVLNELNKFVEKHANINSESDDERNSKLFYKSLINLAL